MRFQIHNAFGVILWQPGSWGAAGNPILAEVSNQLADFIVVGGRTLCISRYRIYDPATGTFLSRDPIGVQGGINRYLYCYNAPLRWVDAFGLVSKAVNGGTLDWHVADNGDDRGSIEATFKPADGCCCKEITFIQVVIARTVDGKTVYPGSKESPESNKDFYMPFSADGSGGLRVDFTFDMTIPYLTRRYNYTLKKWVDRAPNETVGSCDPKKDALYADYPGMDYGGKQVFKAETCAFCIDTQEVLGCITWEIDRDGSDPMVIKQGNDPADGSDRASDGFREGCGEMGFES